jgi:D-alanyl-D-alanine carboxypeptidase/D-alanyl-D-alanine-endopeptidase (penicillin-binding protein 4)
MIARADVLVATTTSRAAAAAHLYVGGVHARRNAGDVRSAPPAAITVRFAAVAALLCVTGCASATSVWPGAPGLDAAPPLAQVIDSVVSSPMLAATSWGIAVRDMDNGEWIARLNAGKHFIPASNTKLVVSAVSLGVLGPDYRWETPVWAKAQAGDTIADGLVVVGRGDPTFSRRFHDGDLTVTDSIADRIAAAGLKHIKGDITIDVSFFGDRSALGAWEVGDLGWSYAPPIDAFAIGEGTFGIVMTGGASPGDPAAIATIDPPGLQALRATAVTDTAGARAGIDVDFLDRNDHVIVEGSVAPGESDTTRLAVVSPAMYAGRALEWALRARGVRVDGEVMLLRDSAHAAQLRSRLDLDWIRITHVASPPLIDVVAAVLRPSQNWIAEHVLKTLGGERRGSGGWNTGIDVERRYLIDVARIDSTGFFLRDASGLSPQNLVTPDMVIALLEHARSSPWGERFREALPEPGMEEGTLENRLRELDGRLRAKTGSITNVNTLSGYITTVGGRTFAFSILTNGSGVSSAAVRQGIDRIVLAIALEGGSP